MRTVKPPLASAAMLWILSQVATCLAEIYAIKPDGTGDFPTVQASIDAAPDGDIIELTDGTFMGTGNRDIDPLGKSMTSRSQSDDPTICWIDCQEAGGGFRVHNGETASTILHGITVLNGYTPEYGGGILCAGAGPLIQNCVFQTNRANCAGGGVCCLYGSPPTLQDCLFMGNISDESIGHGGGMHCGEDSQAILIRCTFWGNQADTRGGGFHCHLNSFALLQNCTFYANECMSGSNVGVRHTYDVLMQTCIVSYGVQGNGVYCEYDGSATLQCSDVSGNEGGD